MSDDTDQVGPQQPRDLRLDHDLASMRYSVSVWERLLGPFLLRMVLVIGSLFGFIFVVLFLIWYLSPPLLETAASLIGVVFNAGIWLGFLFSLFSLRKRARVTVQIDPQGMTLEEWNGFKRVTWAACEDVKLSGRMVKVLIDDDWHTLPSPNAYTDAQWLAQQVQTHIDARKGDKTDVPAEVSAALAALTRRTPTAR